ncbi:hypothetical protein FRC12_011543 [Ceratobasidium sp. 428]|nr:hypothetical protein FRC12_011543 [Ceratobasidium sp. 428]
MLRTSAIASALLLTSYANAFYDTIPVSVWSNSRSPSVIQTLKNHLPEVPSQSQILNALMSTDEMCLLDAVVIIGQPGLHASHLASLSSDSHLRSRFKESASKVHFPYVPISGSADVSSLADDVAAFCQSISTKWSPRRTIDRQNKYVLHLELPEAKERFWSAHDATLETNLADIASTFDSYAIFFTGMNSPEAVVLKRQQPNSLSSPNFGNNPVHAFANVTEPTGGILARYQLLTPGLLTALLIAFGLLIPLLMIGINALASIQNPIRTEAPKGPSLEKKNQ